MKAPEQKPIIPLDTNFSTIDCQVAFAGLTANQALYAYNFAKASWNGTKICFFERSYQSPGLLYLIMMVFKDCLAKQVYEKMKSKFQEIELKKIYIYISAFFDNCGNYKSFGDSKFVPDCSQQNFEKFFLQSQYWSVHKQQFEVIYSKIKKLIFNYQTPYGLIQFKDKNGTTGYYSSNITSNDAQKIKEIFIKKGIMNENNRLIKVDQKKYIVKIASQVEKQQVIQEQQLHITLKYGQFSNFLRLVNKYLLDAQKYSANQTQMKMIDEYICHFRTGDMEKHKQSQRYWIKDKQPVIQTNIGFIESYLDPLKIRAEWEGFVSVVNQQESQLLTKLVQSANITLKYLPWGQNFQVDEFKKPDFTSLQILAFGSSGIPVGINIPNYDDIREHLGFKNVNLGNAYGTPTVQSIQYTPQSQIDLHLKYYKPSLFVIVALHQLLGHGSGKLFHELPNFKNPINGQQIKSSYQKNQTWHSVFGQIASTYEQCRADSVALFLSTYEDVQEILLPKYTPAERWEIVYVAWFDLIVSGLRGMIYYDEKSNKWLQAHIGAGFAIFKVLQQEGGIFEIKETLRNQKQYLQIHLNKQLLATKGRNAIGNFLKHLQVYKSTADFKTGNEYFSRYLQMDQRLMKYREIVIKNKRPRRLTVQPEVIIQQGKVKYVKYDADTFGCIDSGVSHFQQEADKILKQWNENNQQFSY